MSGKLRLSLACGDYEIVRALKDGIVEPDGIELRVLTDMISPTRHWRMLRKGEFDVAEISIASYLHARSRGHPIIGLPVFLHRRFRHGFFFINTQKGIAKPTDLIGKRVGTSSYHAAALLWMRGLLEHEYGVPHKSMRWVTEHDEDVEFRPPQGLELTQSPGGKRVGDMLAEGELDAVLHPDLIEPFVKKDPRVARLFPDYKTLEVEYYRRTGIFPIMHVNVVREKILRENPWVATNLQRAFDQARKIAMRRMENPRIVPLAWYREAWEEQEHMLGADPWVYGIESVNRGNLETIVQYAHEQGLIDRPMTLEELFADVSEGRGRADVKTV